MKAFAFVLALALIACGSAPATVAVAPAVPPTSPPLPTARPSPTVQVYLPSTADCIPAGTKTEIASVVDVVDGDTINVTMNGAAYSVRYIGIDTPERGSPFAAEASAANALLVEGKTVVMVVDTSERDRYDRLLRYVIADGRFVNYDLVWSGMASAYDYPPDTACSKAFHDAQAYASIALLGMWWTAPTARPTVYVPPAFPTLRPTAKPSGNGNCSPAYPGVCIKPPPPDLDCKDIPYRRFVVLSPDPHNFDGDGDGIGCES